MRIQISRPITVAELEQYLKSLGKFFVWDVAVSEDGVVIFADNVRCFL